MPTTNSIEIDLDEVDEIARTYPPDHAVCVVNLIRFKAEADYADAEDPEARALPPVSGETAYFERYLPAFTEAVAGYGGCEVAFAGRVVSTIVGGAEWDAVIIGRYVNMELFRGLVNDEGYRRKAKHHRIAAVEDARSYVTANLP